MSPAPTARARPARSCAPRWRPPASVHAFTSPHLVRFNERIRIAGRLIDDEHLAACSPKCSTSATASSRASSRSTTAVAFLAFARDPADACILEVGLGGRLDATNVIERAAGLRHRQSRPRPPAFPRCGASSDIAAEKAGIAKPGAAGHAALPPAVASRIGDIARQAAQWLPRGWRLLEGTPHWARFANRRAWPPVRACPAATKRRTPPSPVANAARTRSARRPAAPERCLIEPTGRALARAASHGAAPARAPLWLDGGHNPGTPPRDAR